MTDKSYLQPDAVLAGARAASGLEDFDDMRWFEPCRRWLEAVVAEAPLTETGVLALQQSVIGPIVGRLRVADLVRRHPEILDEYVDDPIIIIGMTRTGTTKLQRILAADPSVQSLPLFRLLNPAPLPGESPGQSHLRSAIAHEASGYLRANSPDFFAAHPMIPDEPDEEIVAIEFDTLLPCLRADVPSYRKWWMERPRSERAHMYSYLRLVLQCAQWEEGGRRGRPFVLKSPMHLGELRCLSQAFPRATIVNTHRDINTSVASSARLFELFGHSYSDDVDPRRIGRGVLEIFAADFAHNLADRATLGKDLTLIDVQYDDIKNDSTSVIREIWASRGRRLTEADEERIADWELSNPQHQHGKHSYALEHYGLTTAEVASAFEAYLTAFPESESS